MRRCGGERGCGERGDVGGCGRERGDVGWCGNIEGMLEVVGTLRECGRERVCGGERGCVGGGREDMCLEGGVRKDVSGGCEWGDEVRRREVGPRSLRRMRR